MNMSSVSI